MVTSPRQGAWADGRVGAYGVVPGHRPKGSADGFRQGDRRLLYRRDLARSRPGVTDLVRVWIVAVDVAPDTAARCWGALDRGERTRAAAFLSPRDRQRFVVAHGALRILAGRELGTQPAALTWTPGPDGKPQLAPPWSGLHTNLSHSADMVAVASSTSRPVGRHGGRRLPRTGGPVRAPVGAQGGGRQGVRRPPVAQPHDRGSRPRCRPLGRASRLAPGGGRHRAGGLSRRGGADRRRAIRGNGRRMAGPGTSGPGCRAYRHK